MALSLLTYANRAKVAEALTASGYPVTRMTVNRWAAGGEMPGIATRMILRLFLHDPDTAKEPRPLWAEALPSDVADEVVRRLGGLPGIVERAAAELGLDGPPPAAPLPEADTTPPGEPRTARPRQPKRASR